jgi:hypothetical protein
MSGTHLAVEHSHGCDRSARMGYRSRISLFRVDAYFPGGWGGIYELIKELREENEQMQMTALWSPR